MPKVTASALSIVLGCGSADGATGSGKSSGMDASDSEPAVEGDCGVTEAGASLPVDGGTLFGSMAHPAPCPGRLTALIVAGSGPVDRNGNSIPSLDTNTYLDLAVHLANEGVTSFRYDKRGVGQSASAGPDEAALTFDVYVEDARSWIRSLRQAEPATPLIVLGHSEGSLIGILASQTEAVDALVSLEGAGRPAGEVLRAQLQGQLSASDFATASAIIDQLEAGHMVTDVPSSLDSVFRPTVQPYLISWFRYDPAAEIAKLTIPTMIVQGTADLQVSTEDASLLAAGARRGTLAIIDNMTHTLKLAMASDPMQSQAYTNPALPLAPDFLKGLDAFSGTIR